MVNDWWISGGHPQDDDSRKLYRPNETRDWHFWSVPEGAMGGRLKSGAANL
jgi:hypothetical protein